MKVLVIQNKIYKSIQHTLKSIQSTLDSLNNVDFDFILFPEMFTTPYDKTSIINYGLFTNEIIAFLTRTAQTYHCYVIGGSLPEISQGKYYNTSFIFNRKGVIINKYRKNHLFSITYPNGTTFNEADVITPGNELITFDTEFGKMGICICFDIRFPVLVRRLMKKGASVIFVPASFNTYTGPLHWRITFRARAIDNQLFIIGASPARNSYGSYIPYGHSICVNPLGQVLHELTSKKGYFIAHLDLNQISKTRKQLPIIQNDYDI